jgi:hypothetical protein
MASAAKTQIAGLASQAIFTKSGPVSLKVIAGVLAGSYRLRSYS